MLKFCAVPDEPTELDLQAVNTTSATLNWTIGSGVNENVITLSSMDGSIVFQDNLTSPMLQYDLLEAGTNYTLSVRTRNSAGDSDIVTFMFQTGKISFLSHQFLISILMMLSLVFCC